MTIHVQRLRSACRERCAEFGDPPCFELDCWESDKPDWCKDCRKECGEDVDADPQPLDPDAVVRPLI